MGIVTDYLHNLIAEQVKQNSLIVWFDPDGQYTEFVKRLSLPDATLACYEGSFFKLRHNVDHLLNDENPPKLVVYVPLAYEATHHALVELTVTATVLGTGASPINTRLSSIARRALKDKLPANRINDLVRQTEDGKLNLADLDRLDEREGGSVVLTAIFGTSTPHDVALKFLTDPTLDAKITARNANGELANEFNRGCGMPLPAEQSCEALRDGLALHLLTVEFISSLQSPLPQALAGVPLPKDEAQRTACVKLAADWREQRTSADAYARAATKTEAALQIGNIPFTFEQIRDSDTFVAVERAVQSHVERLLAQQPDNALITFAERRRKGFWPMYRVEIADRWQLACTAARLLRSARRIERELKVAPPTPIDLLRRYTEGDEAWCELDTLYRHLERDWQHLDHGTASVPELTALLAQARHQYMRVGGMVAEAFSRALVSTHFNVADVTRQRDIFAGMVKPAIQQGKTAYVLVDAMRYEMGRELHLSLQGDYDARLSVALGTLPGTTPIGMAALMPGAEGADAKFEVTSDGGLGMRVGGMLLKDRKSRVAYFEQRAGVPVATATLEKMLPKPSATLDKELKAAQIILVTSQELDQLAEGDNIRSAREAMESALRDLARLARVLQGYDCKHIIFTSDHGHLFGEELDDAMKLDPPGGETVYLQRRVWVGRGGAGSDNVARLRLDQLNLGTDLDLASPVGFGGFRVSGGARAYFHGGTSPQELAIPVLTLAVTAPVTPSTADFHLTPTTRKLTTSVYTVRVEGHWTGMFPPQSQRVRVELRQNKDVVSEAMDATYGLDRLTQEIELRPTADDATTIEPNYVTLRVINKLIGKSVTLVLVDALTGVELNRIDKVEVALLGL